MKKLCALLLVFTVLLTVFVHAAEDTVFTVQEGGKTFVVDTAAGTITQGGNVYTYVREGDMVTFTYPDGETYWWKTHAHGGAGGWSEGFRQGAYPDGSTLFDVLQQAVPAKTNQISIDFGNVLAAILIAAFGLWSAISPQSVWYLNHGWRFKDAEPSDAALTITRMGGVLALLLAVGILFL
ncbi:MAG: hypothetical protein IJX64_07120 [Clostridia bacterium]|nr:hypothetical protein [Clostridia bacterium]